MSELLISIISLLSACAIAIVTSCHGRANHKETLDLQKQLNQNSIDADLKAKARIEWIQSVRGETAKLLEMCYEILSTSSYEPSDLKALKVNRIKVTGQSELLKLYFSTKNTGTSNDRSILLNSDNNENKNFAMISLISEIDTNTGHYCNMIFKTSQEPDSKTTSDVSELLNELRTAISIYLKIEWDIAKNGN